MQSRKIKKTMNHQGHACVIDLINRVRAARDNSALRESQSSGRATLLIQNRSARRDTRSLCSRVT